MQIKDESVVLFQGDSITDSGRSRENDTDMGRGYAMMVSAWIGALYPERKIRFVNRGVSGNRVKDLNARWQADCLDIQPDWVSIMIGVNDTWRAFDKNDPTSAEDYLRNYDTILTQVRDTVGSQIILLEPFVLPHPADRTSWRSDISPKIDVVRELAVKYDAILVPLDGIFAEACTRRNASYWARDGVHPSPAGHALIAQSWLQAVD